MSSAVSSPSVQPVLVTAGVTPRTALEVAGVELNGPSGAVVVRDPAGRLRDLDVPFENEEEVEPVALSGLTTEPELRQALLATSRIPLIGLPSNRPPSCWK